MATPNPIVISLVGDNKNAVIAINQLSQVFDQSFKQITQSLTQVAGKIDNTLTGMNSAVEKTGGALSRVGTFIAAAFSVNAIKQFGESVIGAEASLDRLSGKTGIAVETLSALRAKAVENKMVFEEVDVGLGIFADRIFMAVRHGGQMAQVFQDLKVPLLGVGGTLRSTEEILSDVMDRFQKMPDGPEKTAAAMELFGRSGRQWIQTLSQGSDALREKIEKMKAAGTLVTKEQGDRATEFEKSLTQLKGSIMSFAKAMVDNALPTLQSWVNNLQEAVKASRELGTMHPMLQEGIKDVGILAASFFGVGLMVSKLAGWLSTASTAWGIFSAAAEGGLVAGPALIFSAAVFGIVEIIRLGAAAWKAWEAAKNEALSINRLKDANLDLAKSIAKVIEEQEKSGKLSESRAARLRKEVQEALALQAAGNPESARALLSSAAGALVTKPDTKPQPPTPSISDAEAKATLQAIESEAAAAKAGAEVETMQLELSYKKRLVTTEDYWAKKKAIDEEAFEAESQAIQKQIAYLDQVAASEPYNKEKQQKVKEEQQKLTQQLVDLAVKYKGSVAQIDGEIFSAREAAEKKSGEALVTIAEANGKKLIAAQLKIKQQYAQIRRDLETSTAENKPTADQIDAAERAAQAQALVADQVERAGEAEKMFVDACEEARAKVEQGLISEYQGQEEVNRAAKEYLIMLGDELVILTQISQENPGLDGIAKKLADIGKQMEKVKAATKDLSFFGNFKLTTTKLIGDFTNLAKQANQLLESIANTTVSSISDGITGLIMGTKTWGQALKDIETGIVGGIVRAITDMVSQWIVGVTMMGLKEIAVKTGIMTADKVMAKEKISTNTQIGASGAAAGVATAGAEGSWVGIAIFLAALAAGIGIAAAMFAEGGLVSGPGGPTSDSIPARLSAGEFVIPAHRVNQWGAGFFENIRNGAITAQDLSSGIGAGISRPVTSRPGALAGMGVAAGGAHVNVQGHSLSVAFLNSRKEVRSFLESAEGKAMVVDIAAKNKRKMGLKS